MMNNSKLRPVNHLTLSDLVTDRLRTAIRSSALPVGTRLVEEEVARDLNVSRVPVREAIQRLVEEGLVRKMPHRGAFVYLPSADEIEEISSLRVVLECFIVERVMERWTPECEAVLRRIVIQMREAAASGDFHQVCSRDYDFHRTLWEIADHSIMLEVVESLRSRISRFLYEATSVIPAPLLAEHVDTHELMIDVIASGDIAASKAATSRHILGAKHRILTYCSLLPQEPAAE
jgi:DNA-binding GntR family transcriptional regulator